MKAGKLCSDQGATPNMGQSHQILLCFRRKGRNCAPCWTSPKGEVRHVQPRAIGRQALYKDTQTCVHCHRCCQLVLYGRNWSMLGNVSFHGQTRQIIRCHSNGVMGVKHSEMLPFAVRCNSAFVFISFR